MQNKVKSSSLEKESGNLHQSQKQNKNEQKKHHDHLNKKTKIVLGICAMKKKIQSKPMKQILNRIKCKQIQILEMWPCLNHHWLFWPKVDALICFYSDGFPYLMAWQYVKYHSPFLINSLEKQQLLWDRTVVYDILKKIKVPVAKHYYVLRDMNYINQLESKGFGTVIPDPLDLDIPRHFTSRIHSQTPKDYNQRFKANKGQNKLDPIEPIKHQNHLLSQVKEVPPQEECRSMHRVDLSKDSTPQDSLPKNKHKFSDMQIPQQDKDNPSILRKFVQKRSIHLKQYEVQQQDDYILIKYGSQVKKLKKPLVQKPFDSQDHEICIYYPESMGGGRKKLFRKVKDQSSQYENLNSIRRDGNYIYQQFLPNNAFDIKVYTIGPYYMYAQARRSPTLDGVVQRNQQGKQVRYPVILTPDQKFICNKIVQEFEQQVCGFDLLRSNGKSYVCDVNGWSFVKSNPKYWEDCAAILKKKIFNHFFHGKHNYNPQLEHFNNRVSEEYKPPMDYLSPKLQQLRSIVSIFRHGDRSPKLKLKIKTNDERFLQFFKETHKDELKFKDASNLTKILNITVCKIAELQQTDPQIKDYLQMKIVLQSRGHFDGLTRKLQLKAIQRQYIEGVGNKGQVRKVLIVLKWGGELSYSGYLDAIDLGQKMRKQRYDEHDCLSLYSSYRHDVKTYASDQGRCIKTAAAFLKGFLSIEGELAPIISSMVMADNKAQRLLDCTSSQNHSSLSDEIQQRIFEMMNRDQSLLQSYLKYSEESSISESMKQTITSIGHPRQLISQLHSYIKQLSEELKRIYDENYEEEISRQRISTHQQLIDQEKCQDIVMIDGRWTKLKKELYDAQLSKYNISKIPDIYDTIRHDLLKNSLIFKRFDQELLNKLHDTAKVLAHFVVNNEYGITASQRLSVAQDICVPLLEKMKVDLMFWKEKSSQDILWKYRNNAQIQNWRHIRTRLYFTSASHMYSLINILVLGKNKFLLSKTPKSQADKILNILYMGYLSHIQFRLYENLRMQEDAKSFRLQISLSTEYKKNKEMNQFNLGGSEGFTIDEINDFLTSFLVKNSQKEILSPKSEPFIKRQESK